MPEFYSVFAGWLIDGNGSPARENVLIEIEKGEIRSVSDCAEEIRKEKYFLQPDMIDLSGFTVLPGLVDSHVHLTMSGSADLKIRESQQVEGFEDVCKRIMAHLDDHLYCGVLAVRDGGDRNAYTIRFRNSCHNQSRNPVLMKVSGKAWHRKGRYGRLIGRPPSGSKTLAESISDTDEMPDQIKIVNSGLNSLSLFGKQTLPQFTFRELKDAVELAEKYGKKVMVHANGVKPVEIAVAAGCHSIEHGFFMGEDNLKKIAEKGLIWVPTAVTMKAYAGLMKGSNTGLVSEKNLDHQLEQMGLARKFGVKVAIGTDSGSPGVDHGKAMRDEMEIFLEAGFSVEETVHSATSIGADLIGLKKSGRIVKGMRADFIAVKGSPLEFPKSLQSIERIYMDGNLMYKA
ncbi:MAG: amidohydrolase family protein [Deltaproteobacteria bacterium]|nr:amidohydrolase family protein [Deltaproteobacteria bacterium]